MSRQINLFNPLFLKQEKVFSAVTLMQAFVVVVVGALVVSGYTIYNAQEIQKIANLEEPTNPLHIRNCNSNPKQCCLSSWEHIPGKQNT